jgi:hypothetical protein
MITFVPARCARLHPCVQDIVHDEYEQQDKPVQQDIVHEPQLDERVQRGIELINSMFTPDIHEISSNTMNAAGAAAGIELRFLRQARDQLGYVSVWRGTGWYWWRRSAVDDRFGPTTLHVHR